MALSIFQVARTIGDLSGWTKSNLELQKIAYVAEMIHLGRTGRPLTDSDFQAWDRGPVSPDLYHWAKMYGSKPVDASLFRHVTPLSPVLEEYRSIADAYEAMKSLSPWQMVDATHQANGAWAAHYHAGRRGVAIPKTAIQQEYHARIIEDA
ncbi:hypothetical protein ASE86_06780 [Sphingomonas sp. Leaf33]|uniref:Panacea domain-containing protein n=1 Tax=Sphingomonas sp. Leaf33 TaxID=1736215 RepID=UPI0006F3C6E1|nr:Panacea domain-containing protein [Sphingomonas sp. Leaf33]KQN25891.1 hypothetical protein ASE86_06780 [Sphingomonas sp. Leaf33]